MKVMLLNGSSHKNGCTATALSEVASQLEKEGIETEIVHLGGDPVRDCIACGKCAELKSRCVFDDDMANTVIEKAEGADGFIFGSPVYYAHPAGRILAILNRAFYAGGKAFAKKPGAVVVSARRAGTTASFDVLNKYFSMMQMPIVTSTYWNMVHGNTAKEAKQDLEGMQTMRNLARNMALMLKNIEAGKKAGVSVSKTEWASRTNFIR